MNLCKEGQTFNSSLGNTCPNFRGDIYIYVCIVSLQKFDHKCVLGPWGTLILILEGRVYYIKEVRVVKRGKLKKNNNGVWATLGKIREVFNVSNDLN